MQVRQSYPFFEPVGRPIYILSNVSISLVCPTHRSSYLNRNDVHNKNSIY